MTRIVRSVGFVLALGAVGLGGGAFAWSGGGTAGAQSGGVTPLPPGWELCVLQGIAAPATQANIADLDEWQAAEGGSTNNTADFNPFNTLRTSDVTGAPLPGVVSANGFPAYPNWATGCAATVATLVQPNMWVITAGLRAGNVTPAGAFLAVVDQSAWCAPSNGVPCYLNQVLAAGGSLPAAAPSSALDVYGNVQTDLQAYQQSINAVTADQAVLAAREQDLAASESQVSATKGQFGAASRALQGFAVSEYVSSGLYSGAPLVSNGGSQPLTRGTPQNADGVVVQQYLGVAAANLITRNEAAADAFKGSQQQRDDAAKAVTQASVTLTSDEAAENRDLAQLITDVATLEHAGACATVTITPPAPSPSAAATTTPTTTVPTTTSTTVPPTTTTTTEPPTTTTTAPTILPLGSPPPTTTTTVPPTTTTTTAPPTTTTTTSPTTAAPAPSTAPPVEAPGVSALQGCIATFAPPAGA
jgi:hypothetical protein